MNDVRDSLVRDVAERLVLGRQRYGHGVVVPVNAEKDWERELVEELLDAIVYAAANVLKKKGVNDDEDNAALLDEIRDRMFALYDCTIPPGREITVLDLCLFGYMSVKNRLLM